MSLAGLRVAYYRVHALDYPRNRRIRGYLTERGAEVTVVPSHHGGSRVGRLVRDLVGLHRAARRADVVVLGEMRLKHAGPARIIAALARRPLVVDGFIGLWETEVGDWGSSAPASLRSRGLRVLDRIALRSADLYLVDTELRARSIRATTSSTLVRSLAVGAPSWAAPTMVTPTPASDADDALHLLYYGNYIPLHGLEVVLDAVAAAARRRPVRMTLIGDGPRRAGVEALADRLGLSGLLTFRDPVPESALAAEIAAADVVLGVFGSSDKARSVIANKVWQGLASGRTTITQESAALDEIRTAAGPLLVETEQGSAAAVADAIIAAPRAAELPGDADVAERLEAVVLRSYDAFAVDLRRIVR